MDFFRNLASKLRFLLWGSLIFSVYQYAYKPLQQARYAESGGLNGEDLRILRESCREVWMQRQNLHREPSSDEMAAIVGGRLSPSGQQGAYYDGNQQGYVSRNTKQMVIHCP